MYAKSILSKNEHIPGTLFCGKVLSDMARSTCQTRIQTRIQTRTVMSKIEALSTRMQATTFADAETVIREGNRWDNAL